MAISEKDRKLEKKLNVASILVSIVVLLLVVLMRRVKIDVGIDFSFLPPFHAFLNSVAAIFLMLAFRAIKRRKIELHQKYIYWAIGFSGLFLLSYVVYHFTTPETAFCKYGTIRYIYFFFLITHVFLAAAIFPFILLTFTRAYTNQFQRHKKMARWVFPLWLYVAVTGPLVYFMLAPCY
ncbi:DUF420 domain-containing protein [Membranihabitans maritimus]|uniref:DUF420 domain-containing protein n=1 Tax=Membranihabitans maritimus TaxID=2904244 RepID=UPI001F39AE3E|nr:DUF420 domain-containing protein [Membranihabitans maritimus]